MKPVALARKSALKGGGLQRSPRPGPIWLKVPAASSAIPARWRSHHTRLTRLLEKLRSGQRGHLQDAAELRPGFCRTTAENAGEEFDRDMLLAEVVSAQNLIYEVEQALKRIGQGTYGICELTGKPISKARLRAVPWTRFSQPAEAALEQNGSVHFQRLGDLCSVQK